MTMENVYSAADSFNVAWKYHSNRGYSTWKYNMIDSFSYQVIMVTMFGSKGATI